MQNNTYLKKISKFSVFFIVNILLLFIISLSTIYSATVTKSESFFIKEIIWFVISIFVFVVVSLIDYRKYYKYSAAIYIFNILMLLSVLVIGTSRLGAKRWIDLGPLALQPSEFSKLFLIFTFSAYLINNYSDKYTGFKAMFMSFLHIFPVFFLIAIGSGKIFGKGFLNNTQGKLKYLPESHTDFIGSVFLEERGFLGGSMLLLIYIVLLAQILYIADTTEDKFGKYVCYGIATIFFFHIFVNMGMIMGIMPVTGLPLLLMSYGGSSLVFSFLILGVVQSVKIHRGTK